MNNPVSQGGRDSKVIVVVDDDAGIRTVLRAYLETAYTVLEAEDGPTALELISQQSADLVLMDVRMPGLSGLEICRTLKQRKGDAFLPVLLLTALEQQESRNEGLGAGADDFLTKPVDRRELLLRVAAFLRIREQDQVIRKQLANLQRVQSLKDYLFKLIVHDLRNPLATVEGYVKMILEEARGREETALHDYAAHALHGSAELSEILDGVAEVYVLEEGKRSLSREPVPVRLLVHEALEELAPDKSVEQPHVEVEVEGNPVLSLDHRLVRRSVENLIAHALTYSSDEDAVLVTVRPENGGVMIEVADRGPGIPDELKETLFEKFGSVEGWRSASRRGLGLSLHLVKLVASAHGGTVSIHDRDGGGEVVRLFLPGEVARAE